MKYNLVDMLSIGANISTIVGVIVAILTLWNFYRERRKQIEYQVKKDFYDGKVWEDSIEDDNGDAMFFTLEINNAPFFALSGEIYYSDTHLHEKLKDEDFKLSDMIFFRFKKAYKRKITLEIYREIPISEVDIREDILGTATLKHLSPDAFYMTFNKEFLPDIPRDLCLSSFQRYYNTTNT